MEVNKLTARKVASLKKRGWVSDGHGLGVSVRGGSKTWTLRFTLRGKTREMGLGSTSVFRLAEARERARQARQLIADGIDPVEHRRQRMAELKRQAAAAITFKQAADLYLAKNHGEWRNQHHVYQWRTTLGVACAAFGDVPVGMVTRDMVLKCLEPMWLDRRETAARLRGRIEKVLGFCIAHGWASEPNVARWRHNLDHSLPALNRKKRVKHFAALPWRDVPGLMQELRVDRSGRSLALQFTILTASRASEVAGARWSEVDLDEKLWTIPMERIKGGKEHRVPLADAAVAVLKQAPRQVGNDFIFVGDKRPALRPTAMLELMKQLRPKFVVHGLRSSFRDWAGERTGFANHVIELALAHTVGSAVERAYRRSDLLNLRRELMDAWAAYVTAPAAEKVVSIR